MPIFEYHCQECKHDFELLVGVGTDSGALKCPRCGSDQLKKMFSKFAARSKSGGGAVSTVGSSGCGGCSSTNCGSCS